MSNEPRISDQVISVRAPRVGCKIQHELLPKMRVEIFGAYQFRGKHNRVARNFSPKPPVRAVDRDKWYHTMYRLRIDEAWYSPSNVKYTFFTMQQVIELIANWVPK